MAFEMTLEDRDLMDDVAKNAELSGQEIATHMLSLMNHLASTTPQNLVGQAGGAFTTLQGIMQEKLTNICDALNDLAVMVRSSGSILDAADSEAATTVNQIASVLSGARSSM
jgi:hypothetical protein